MGHPKTGWFRTRPDDDTDGIFWRSGLKFGRVLRGSDGRWHWTSWCRWGGAGIFDADADARRAVEAGADATRVTESCHPHRWNRPWRGLAMSRVTAGVAITLSTLTAAQAIEACAESPRYTCVVDGDTLWYDGEKIRLAAIDAPEVQGQCAGEIELARHATERLIALIDSCGFIIEREGTDRYGRTLANLKSGETTLGQLLIDEGLARSWSGRREPWCKTVH